MYKLFMILNENGQEVPSKLKNSLVKVTDYFLNGCLVFTDVITNSVICLEERIIGVYCDKSVLVVKNKNSTYCFVPV